MVNLNFSSLRISSRNASSLYVACSLVRHDGFAPRYLVSYRSSNSLLALSVFKSDHLHRSFPLHQQSRWTPGTTTQCRDETGERTLSTYSSQTNIQPIQLPDLPFLLSLEVLDRARMIVRVGLVARLHVCEVLVDFVVGEDGGLCFDYLGGEGVVC